MSVPIKLLPSSDENRLTNTINDPNRGNRPIILMPGQHLTKPGRNESIPIGKNGLHIKGFLSVGEFSSIKRPDNAIDLNNSDSNYGLFFVPSAPTPDEWAG